MERFVVGLINVAVDTVPFCDSFSSNSATTLGASSSRVDSRRSTFNQNTDGVRPWDHDSWSSAAPWMYPFSEVSAPWTRREAVHRTMGWKFGNEGGEGGRGDVWVDQIGRRGLVNFERRVGMFWWHISWLVGC